MPTGYTSDVQSGKVSDFNQFAMNCARAFGALITMRDDPQDAEIPQEFKPSTDYHDQALASARADLIETKAMTPARADAAARKAYNTALASWEERKARKAAERLRYEAMLAKVKLWTPPSPEHVGMKDFMIEQLTGSIDFDCNDKYDTPPDFKRGEEWRQDRITSLRRDIDYHTNARADEIKRTEGRNRWVAQLRGSLEAQ